MTVREEYSLKVEGKQFHVLCRLIVDGKEVSYGISKVYGRKNFKADIGKKMALGNAVRIWFKGLNTEIIDNIPSEYK